ncbi:glycosyltransferase family 2 protein [Flavobacterium restrictum]|uniref:Glycosyltransferase family 2 protein n=1 Tax=Flavobacterium restrictum TaxID=2594428 RepID=A0A553DSE0_9FLAO|nr:glycosyltransferase family 2 protein [Flavobacterium restrictum]TRX35649.1 glycosyltransferase family 2 protein [Flavobacterium restrictum]
MQLSVIILNYNVCHFLELCVESVQSALENLDAEIIVVDNNSVDASATMMKSRFPAITYIQNKDNVGFPKGNNIGVAQAQGEYICILNPDTVVAENTFVKVLDFAQKQQNLGIVGVKLIDGTGKFLPESKRGVPTPFVAFTKIMGLYAFFPKVKAFGCYYASHLQENQTGKVAILVGAFVVMKRDLYLEVGGFDENCFMYSDDIDLSYMVLQKGKSNYYFHETTVIHYKGESTIKDGTYLKRFQEAMNFFYKKHFRVSLFFDFFMKIGAFFFAFAKKNQTNALHSNPEEYLLFSTNVALKNKIEKQLQKKVHWETKIAENWLILQPDLKGKHIEIILDAASFSFQECISFLEKYTNTKAASYYTFKIIPKSSRFMIGSNSSNDRGEIIKIE